MTKTQRDNYLEVLEQKLFDRKNRLNIILNIGWVNTFSK